MVGKDYTLPSFELPKLLDEAQKADLAASFQTTAVQTLVETALKAEQEYQPKNFLLAGGVAANVALRQALASQLKTPLLCPDIKLCTDNATMIAAMAFYVQNQSIDPHKLEVIPSLR